MDQRLCIRRVSLSGVRPWQQHRSEREREVGEEAKIGPVAPPDLYVRRGGVPDAKNRQLSLLLLRSSSLFSFPSSQPRVRREGEEEIRRAPEGEERSYAD